MSHEYIFKYIIVGEMSVGKTCLTLQFTDKIFRLRYSSTFGVEFGVRTVNIGGTLMRIHILDTSGQERFNAVARSYYRGAAVALLVYDITNRNTFKFLPKWLKQIRDRTSPYVGITLIGNKCDLGHLRQVTKREGEIFARDNGLDFKEVSAKTAAGVEDAFIDTAEKINEKIQAGVFDVTNEANGRKLSNTSHEIPQDLVKPTKKKCPFCFLL